MARATSWIAALGLLLPLHTVAAILPFSIATADLRSWFWPTSVVVGKWLYIAGGELWYVSANTIETAVNNNTIVVDLSQSWSTTSVNATVDPTTDDNLLTREPTLWYNPLKNKVNVYGGWPYQNGPAVHVSSFTPNAAAVTWTTEFKKGDSSSFKSFTRKMGGLVATSPTTYYNLGGVGTENTDPDFGNFGGYGSYYTLGGMVLFDFATETWTNQSVGSQRVHGQAHYIPIFGDKGVLVFLGGDEPTAQNPFTDGGSLVPMDTITVYDIANQKFYEQKANGTIPIPRTTFCSVVVAGASNTSYEIYIFGGLQAGTLSQATQTEMGTIYILSLPAFQWVTTSVSSWWRYAHYCQVIGSRQMLSIGGTSADFSTKDNFPNGLGIFDLVDLTWKTDYDPTAAAYGRPGLVEALYANNIPKATVTWSDPALQTIFKASTSASTTSSATGSTSPASSSSTNIAGPVAGGVVGGVVAIAAIVFGVWYLRRRRQQPQTDKAQAEMDGTALDEIHQPKPLYEMQQPNVVHEMHSINPNDQDPLKRKPLPAEMA